MIVDSRLETPLAARLWAVPDRRVLIETYIPALARIGGRVLWIGCRAYTRQDYPALARHGADVGHQLDGCRRSDACQRGHGQVDDEV